MSTLFLAKVFGIYFVVVGIVVLIRGGSILPIIREVLSNRALMFILGAIELAGGLFLVLAYPMISISLPGIISLIGWMMIVESILYLLLPVKEIRKMVGSFNKKNWYVSGAVISIILGAYLAGMGFGFVMPI